MIPPKEQSEIKNSRLGDPKRSNLGTSNIGVSAQK